jgi:small redox-active disulfide protein 2
MEIKILGGGCPNCKRLEALAREVAAELGVDATFTKVTDAAEIMEYDIVSTPALVIDGNVVSSGRVPRKDEIANCIEAIGHS